MNSSPFNTLPLCIVSIHTRSPPFLSVHTLPPHLFSVRLGRGIDGWVQIRNLADGFVKNFKKKFEVGQLVKAKVIGYEQKI